MKETSKSRIEQFIVDNGLFTGQTSENARRNKLMGLSSHTTMAREKEAYKAHMLGDPGTVISFKGGYPKTGCPVTLISHGIETRALDGHLTLSDKRIAKIVSGNFQGYLRNI